MRSTPCGWLALGFALLVAACSFPTPPGPSAAAIVAKKPLMDEFDRNLATWQASGITRYAFTWNPTCFCDTRSRLVVGDGDSIRIDGVPAVQGTGDPAGVPGLFEIVRRAIEGDSATIEYDPVTGVPTHMISDPIKNAIDDELTFSVDNWTLDPPDDRLLGEVTRATSAWAGRRIQTYELTLKINHEVYLVKVKDGNPTATQGGRPIKLDLDPIPATIDALLDTAAYSATRPGTSVTFDPELRYPTLIVIGPDPVSGFKGQTIKVMNFRQP